MNVTSISNKPVNKALLNIKVMLGLLSNKRYVIPLTVTLTLAFFYSTVSYAAEPNAIRNELTPNNSIEHNLAAKQGRHHKMERMAKRLQLNTKQREEIKAIKLQAKKNNKAVFESIKRYRNELKVLIQADFFDEQAVTSLHQSYQSNLMQAALAKAKTQHATFQVLTAKQQTQWLAFTEKRHKNRFK